MTRHEEAQGNPSMSAELRTPPDPAIAGGGKPAFDASGP